MNELRGTVRVGESAVAAIAGPALAPVFSAVVALTIFGCLSANIFYCARVPYAMARDGLFFRSLGRLHPRRRVPVRALWAQSAVAVALILTGTFQKLIDYVLFGLVFFFAATGAAVIVLRRKAPAVERPYRLKLYPVVPLVFSAVNAAIFVALAIEQPKQAAVAAVLICSGVPAFFIWNARRKTRPPENAESPGGH
jgi:APA family basic amino acid/polyamine antiporter